ncbi:MAG: hypothetical protein ACREAC_20225, partial [Blastocatellia bacterium]
MTPEARFQTETSSTGAAAVPARTLESAVEQSVARATDWLLSAQAQEGYWWGELEADTTLESDYILYLHLL